MTKMRTATLASVAAVMMLVGCAAGTDDQQDELSYEDSPLSEFLGFDAEFDEEEYQAEELEVQELIAACMADEGFEYIPFTGNTFTATDFEDQNTEEWIAENGYGFSGSSEPVDEDAVEDPNAEYVESLSESEMTAYYEALYGPTPSEDELSEDGSWEYDWEQAGCQGAADHEVRGDMIESQDEFQDLFDAMSEMYTQMESSPEMADLNAEWSSCMADAGQADLATPSEAMDRAMEASNALWEDADPETGPSEDDMAQARDEEIEIALADFRCREELDYDDAQLTVQFALEEQFIEDHRDELEAYRASIEQGS